MASFQSVPLKKTYEVDLVKPLRSFIQNTFSQADPDEYNNALSEFHKLRNLMITKSVDKHESALEVLYRYYDQLTAIENKLPITENQIRVHFKWRDAFDEGGFLTGKRTLAIASALYEKVCVLFNVAALMSQIAGIQNVDADEGLKMAVKYFQYGSGIFGHLKDVVLSHVQQEPTPDLNPDTLAALAALMLAQAQEAIFKKASLDRMKDAMVAKLAYQCSELYADAMKLMQLTSIRDLWPRDWIGATAMKQAAFHAMAEFHQSQVCKAAHSYGEEIARLQHAIELMQAAQTRGGGTFTFKNELGKIQRAMTEAEKDNNFIYHDKVPARNTLAPIGRAPVAKPTQLPARFSTKFVDLFEKLVPLPVYEAMTAFENRKGQIVNMEVGRLREATTLMNSVLASLNLPAAIEDLSGEKVPQSLLEKATEIQQLGGFQYIDKLMSDLPELLTRNREILTEAVRMLDEEEGSDKQLRDKFKERWTRKTSESLTKPLRDEVAKYQQILDTAIGADKIVREKYEKHKAAIQLLTKPVSELEKAIPSGSGAGGLQGSPVVQTLRQLVEEVNTIKAERDVMESEIKSATFDMSSKFMAALSAEGLINEEPMSNSELNRVYSSLREQVTDSLQRQESVLARIQNANTEFCQAKSGNQGTAQRETMLKDLAAGYDMFKELTANLEEGTKFYNDLTPLLVRLQSRISDFVFARKTEKDELMADLQASIVNTPSSAPPSAPRYQGGPPTTPTPSESASGQPRPTPPPRPPPPTVSSASQHTPTSQPAGTAAAGASAPPASQAGPPGGLPYPTQPGQPGHPGQAPPGYGAAPNWNAPYPQQPGYGGYPMPAMPSGYNPYFQPPPYSQQGGYPSGPITYPQQGYPQQGYPQQGYPSAPYPQQTQWR